MCRDRWDLISCRFPSESQPRPLVFISHLHLVPLRTSPPRHEELAEGRGAKRCLDFDTCQMKDQED